MKRNIAKIIAVNAIVGALYAVLTLPLGTISLNSYIQFRPAEALTILPALAPYTVVGLTIGCAVSNTISAFGIWDIMLGSLTTLIAGLLTATPIFRKSYLAPIPPVVLNAVCLPLIWMIADPSGVTYHWSMLSLLLTQSVVIFGLGIPLYYFTKKKLMRFVELEKGAKNDDNQTQTATHTE